MESTLISLAENDEMSVLEAILRHFPAGISLTDRRGRVVLKNQSVSDMLDLPEYLRGIDHTDVDVVRYLAEQGHYGPGDVETLVAARMKIVGSRELSHYELHLKTGRVIEIRSAPVEHGGLLRIFVDITDRRREELRMARMAQHEAPPAPPTD